MLLLLRHQCARAALPHALSQPHAEPRWLGVRAEGRAWRAARCTAVAAGCEASAQRLCFSMGRAPEEGGSSSEEEGQASGEVRGYASGQRRRLRGAAAAAVAAAARGADGPLSSARASCAPHSLFLPRWRPPSRARADRRRAVRAARRTTRRGWRSRRPRGAQRTGRPPRRQYRARCLRACCCLARTRTAVDTRAQNPRTTRCPV